MTDRDRKIVAIVALILLAFFAAFVWPTIYRYDQATFVGNQKALVRTNRFTGNSQVMTPYGWHRMEQRANARRAPA
jgi:hypothetical protein